MIKYLKFLSYYFIYKDFCHEPPLCIGETWVSPPHPPPFC